jgi:hypothetical protein
VELGHTNAPPCSQTLRKAPYPVLNKRSGFFSTVLLSSGMYPRATVSLIFLLLGAVRALACTDIILLSGLRNPETPAEAEFMREAFERRKKAIAPFVPPNLEIEAAEILSQVVNHIKWGSPVQDEWRNFAIFQVPSQFTDETRRRQVSSDLLFLIYHLHKTVPPVAPQLPSDGIKRTENQRSLDFAVNRYASLQRKFDLFSLLPLLPLLGHPGEDLNGNILNILASAFRSRPFSKWPTEIRRQQDMVDPIV